MATGRYYLEGRCARSRVIGAPAAERQTIGIKTAEIWYFFTIFGRNVTFLAGHLYFPHYPQEGAVMMLEASDDRTGQRQRANAPGEQQTVRAAFHLLFCCGFGVERSFIGACFGVVGFSSVNFGLFGC